MALFSFATVANMTGTRTRRPRFANRSLAIPKSTNTWRVLSSANSLARAYTVSGSRYRPGLSWDEGDLAATAVASRDSEAPAIKMLIAACAELNRIEWPAEIRRTEDFVVYPVDFELGSLKRNLKACVGRSR